MKRHFVLILALLLPTSPTVGWSAQHAVDEEVVFGYSAAVRAGDRAAIKAVFALDTDGASAEAQDIVLGELIPQHPRLFLEMLQQSQFAGCQACLPGLLGNLGADYVDRPAAQVRVLERRRDALQAVDVESLARLRDTCVVVLDRQIRSIQSVMGPGGS